VRKRFSRLSKYSTRYLLLSTIERAGKACKILERMNKHITLAHGNGGRLMHELVDGLRLKFSNKILNELADAAELFFPGGDIGKLAVCGTVNDVSMKAATPLFISLSFIIEEGFEFDEFDKICCSIRKAAEKAEVSVVTGDIKVVEKGAADKLFINTSGIGLIKHKGVHIGSKAKVGDVIIINGPIAEHGIAIINARENLGFESGIRSDCRNLNFEVQRCIYATKKITVLRDPTRGGLATTLGEIARSSNLGIEIFEELIPIKPEVKKLCDILGFDPLYVPNEGKFVCFVNERDCHKVKRAIGKAARIIGRVTSAHKKVVYLKTELSSTRVLPVLEVDQLPRIC